MIDADLSAAESLVGMAVADVEQALILATLHQTYGNRTHAANMLGSFYPNYSNKLSAYAQAGMFIDGRAPYLRFLVTGDWASVER